MLAIFDMSLLGDVDFEWLRVFADHATMSIINARAFEEIEFLKARLEEENNYLREEVTTALGAGEIIGQSSALKKVLHQIELVAPTEVAVLIHGESGTGKELVARAIHQRSPRQEHPLIKVNCGAIPENLFESEFFGHARGAFTGAIKDKPGRFELADQGTLFLDEIAELPLAMQAKLLRVLQEHEIERVGETRPRKVDVRIVAASNRELKQAVTAGRFREDLFYRLNVVELNVPPLRERREEILPLARQLLAKSSQGRARLSASVGEILEGYSWPGNVRELSNVMERAALVSGSELILPEHLPARLRAASKPAPPPETTDGKPLDEIENQAILEALKKHQYNRTETAKALGISRRALLYKIERLRELGHDVDGH